MSKPLRCYLRLHRWHNASTEDGSYRFRKCDGCGKEQTQSDRAHWSAGGGMGGAGS